MLIPRRLPVVLAALALSASALAGPASGAPVAAAPEGAADLAVTGFALGSLGPERLAADADVLDTVTVAGVGLRAGGGSVEPPTADMERVRRRAAGHGLDTELILSNYSNRLEAFDPQALHRLLSDPARIRRVVRQVTSIVTEGGWGGVNVDLELVQRRDRAGLVDLVRAFDARLPEGSTLSIDVSAATSVEAYRDRGYELGEIGEVVDVVVLMTYDLHGPTWSGPGPIGDVRWQRRAVAAASDVVSPSKLDLGIAGYGYTWPRRGTGRSITPQGARRMVARDGVRAVWHPASGEWSARLDDGTRIWWSDARSYAKRVRLARSLDLHGVAVWRLGSADPLI